MLVRARRRARRTHARPRARWLAVGAAVAVGAVLVPPSATAAPPRAVRCGDVVSGAAVLRHDLRCAGDVGLTLLAGASLDLRGHRLTGPGAGVGLEVPATGDVTIRRGTVSGWAQGVAVADEEDGGGGLVTVERTTFTRNGTAIASSAGFSGVPVDFVVRSSHFADNDRGLSSVFYAGSFDVTSSRFTRNDVAVNLITGGARLTDSRLDHNRVAVSCDESACRLERTTVADNSLGVDVRAFGAEVVDSTLVRNDVAVRGFTSWGLIELTGSLLRDNGTAVELSVATIAATGNTFRGNDVAYVDAEVDENPFGGVSTLLDNRFVRNGDGVLAVSPGTELGGNSAVRNARWGIHAPGAVDLGGNTARGNGNEPQCVGVVCDGSSPTS